MHVDKEVEFLLFINAVCVLFSGKKSGVRSSCKRRKLLECLSEGILLAVTISLFGITSSLKNLPELAYFTSNLCVQQ